MLIPWLLSAAIIAGVVVLLRKPLLRGVARFLVVDDRHSEADFVYLLNGLAETRSIHAARLLLDGRASQILVSQSRGSAAVNAGLVPNETDIAVELMAAEGVPRERITVLPAGDGVASTRDEAVALARFVRDCPVSSVIVVTCALHTRRARWAIARAVRTFGVRVFASAVPHSTFDHSNWWRHETGLTTLVNEYLKLAFYLSSRSRRRPVTRDLEAGQPDGG